MIGRMGRSARRWTPGISHAHSPGLHTVVRATTEQTKRQVSVAEEALGTRIWVAIPQTIATLSCNG
jgi:hypothetical protein